MLLAAAFFWIALTLVVCYVAHEKGRNAFAWFLVSLIFSPAIGFLAMLAVPSRPKEPPIIDRGAQGERKAKSIDEYLRDR